ncbi:MAG: hypothetical protein ABFD86_13150 [Bryobacteraceae bacterium]
MSMWRIMAGLAAGMAGVLALAQAGTVHGTIQGADGKAVGIVTVYLQGQMTDGVRASSVVGKSAKDGSFTLSGVGVGTYRLCVPNGAEGYVDPCVWDASPTTVKVKANESVNAGTVPLTPSATVALEVADEQGYLAAHEASKIPRAALMAGVRAAHGQFVPMTLSSSSDTSRRYTASIPAGQQVRVLVQSQDYQIAENGTSTDFTSQDRGLTAKVQPDSAGVVNELKIRVTGKR